MEKFESSDFQNENLEASEKRVAREFEKLEENVKKIEDLDLPKEEEEKLILGIISKVDALRALCVGFAAGSTITLYTKAVLQNPTPENMLLFIGALGAAFTANYLTTMSIGKERT